MEIEHAGYLPDWCRLHLRTHRAALCGCPHPIKPVQQATLSDKLHVGKAVVNGTSPVRIDSMPFGGFRKSGVGREGIRHAVLESTTRSSEQEPANQDDGDKQGCRTADSCCDSYLLQGRR
ncbi:aldehyde dehydrogenase family protein [Arthrobacter rhizosphaerae]|uniref:aldehyde dehydrogenase family protein n=1 Tax=Arthrobacter rhizosphaerae TaxID=2855490 RepID=UPI00355885B4